MSQVRDKSVGYAVRRGYKQTEVGWIPEDWDVKPLSEVCFFRSGKAHEPFVHEFGDFICVNSKFISSDGRVVKRCTHNLCPAKENDILMVMSDLPNGKALAKVFLADQDNLYAVNQRVCALTSYGASEKYLCYTLNRNPYFLAHDDGVTQTHLLNKVFANCPVLVPPTVREQQAIAEAISNVDATLDVLSRLIAKKRDLKQAAMQQLLTGQTRLPGFDGDWETKRLGDLGTFLKGSGVRKDQAQSGRLPCIRYGEIYTVHSDVIRSFQSWISADVAETATAIFQGDLVFAGSGETKAEIGKCVAHVGSEQAYAGGDTIILRLSGVDCVFMGYSCNTPSVAKQKSSLGQGDAVVHISSKALASVVVEVPPIAEQTAIATVLSDIDAEIEKLEARLDKTRMLKAGMMQELLTGRTRLLP